MNKLIVIAVIVFAGYTGFYQYGELPGSAAVEVLTQQPGGSDEKFASAYRSHTSNLQMEGSGKVVKLLPDDNEGSRHQRFVVRLNSGQTLLVAHNIELAPRIESVNEGDAVSFYGQYEWNEKGGVIHWTHNDPDGSHIAGWIEYNGRKYQ